MPRNRRATDQATATFLESLAAALGEDRETTVSERVEVTYTDEAGAVRRYIFGSDDVERPNALEEANTLALAARDEFDQTGTTKRSSK